ncbi:MAG: DegV family protein [Clostridia bacterium]|nr:DegV family protein [Clostridia bacterium]
MNFRIVADSSADILEMENVEFAQVPLKIITADKEYVDNDDLDVEDMLSDLEKYKGKSSSSCPNVTDWLGAFGDADCIFCITITSGLSGSYNCAQMAAKEHMYNYPDKKVYVVDSLSTGPESALIAEKLRELILEGLEFEEIVDRIKDYQKRTHLIFALESLHNLANNGRVSPLVAKLAGVLDIRVVGKASDVGTLEMTNKIRGAYRTMMSIIDNMKKSGYEGGRMRIHHCCNLSGAKVLCGEIRKLFPMADIKIRATRALCSFYAERGGLLVGFEGV